MLAAGPTGSGEGLIVYVGSRSHRRRRGAYDRGKQSAGRLEGDCPISGGIGEVDTGRQEPASRFRAHFLPQAAAWQTNRVRLGRRFEAVGEKPVGPAAEINDKLSPLAPAQRRGGGGDRVPARTEIANAHKKCGQWIGFLIFANTTVWLTASVSEEKRCCPISIKAKSRHL